MKKLALVLFLIPACGEAPATTSYEDAGRSDGGTLPDVIDINVGSDAGATVANVDMSPLTLVPPFSPDVHDYYVRCTSGDNTGTLTVSLSDDTMWQSAFDIIEDQAVVLSDAYWIRCLPHDFPEIDVTKNGTPTPGYYLVNGSFFGIVFDTNGTPVWYTRGPTVLDVDSLAVNTISLSPNETVPYGDTPDVHFEEHALDSEKVTTVYGVGTPADAHELRLLANGDHLVLSYAIEPHVDLTGLQSYGDDVNMADCEIQEIDPHGNLVWSWLASDHIDAVHESIEPAANVINGQSVVDVFHCNSIDVGSNGDLLISSRHTNAVFDVDRASGTVLWKLGGTDYNKDGAEKITPDSVFEEQHDARFTPAGNVTLFDDHTATPGLARGLELALDHDAHTATTVFHYEGKGPALYEGSFRRYADGHSVVGWGYVADDPRILTEVDEAGNDVFDITMPGNISYRAIKVPLSQLDIALLRATAGL